MRCQTRGCPYHTVNNLPFCQRCYEHGYHLSGTSAEEVEDRSDRELAETMRAINPSVKKTHVTIAECEEWRIMHHEGTSLRQIGLQRERSQKTIVFHVRGYCTHPHETA